MVGHADRSNESKQGGGYKKLSTREKIDMAEEIVAKNTEVL